MPARLPRRPPAPHRVFAGELLARIDLSARRGEGCPPRLPVLASRAPRSLRRPPDRPQARAEAAGVAAGGIPPRAGSEGRLTAAGVGGGAVTGDPRSSPRAPVAGGGTLRLA